MRFIYIVGILLLIAIGFLVYFYRDWLWGTIDGFQGAAGGNVVFQLFEQRCSGTTKFFPTVSKANAILMCNKLGGRLATYDELKAAVSDNLIIENDKPAMVLDSDLTYVSKDTAGTSLKKLVVKAANEEMIIYTVGPENDTRETFSHKGYDSINNALDWPARCRTRNVNLNRYVDNGSCTSATYYELDGYVKTVPFSRSTLNLFNTREAEHFYFDRLGYRYFKRTPAATETYGHPVCIAGTAPPGNTVDVVFPTRVGKGWVPYNDTTEILAGSSFTKRYNIRKQGDTTTFNKACPITDTSAAGSTITLVSSTDPPSVSLNTPAPTTPQTSYNILNIDRKSVV